MGGKVGYCMVTVGGEWLLGGGGGTVHQYICLGGSRQNGEKPILDMGEWRKKMGGVARGK